MPPAGSGSTIGGYEVVVSNAVVGFVDLSGFTAASEQLGRLGPLGTEQMRNLINAIFTPAIDIVHQAGGEIGWFAGDAIGVLFDADVVTSRDGVRALSDVAAAIAELPAMETDAGAITMAAKVGVAHGQVNWHRVTADPKMVWFGGRAVDLAAAAEHHAEPGDVVLDRSVVDAVDLVGESLGMVTRPIADSGCAHLLSRPSSPQSSGSGSKVALAKTLAPPRFLPLRDPRFQPPRVFRLAAKGDAAFLDEHRPVTVLFVQPGTETHDVELLLTIRNIIGDLGGLTQATEGDKGANLLAIFGAPTALADRQARALLAAERIRELVPEGASGIASGRVFAGRVGSEARWDYSVLGDRVNTAARLMVAAGPGEILIDAATDEGVGALALRGETRELALKGKTKPELATVVTGLRRRSAEDALAGDRGLFVGRQAETEELLAQFETPGLTVATGPAGAGKSRLLMRALELAPVSPVSMDESSDTDVAGDGGAASAAMSTGGPSGTGETVDGAGPEPVMVAIEQTDRGQPFGMWQRLLPPVVGVEPAEFLGALPEALADDSRLPLLGPMLGTIIADTPLTASLSADDRPELLASLVVEIIDAVPEVPVVTVEDLHWADEGSLDLLRRVAGRLPSTGLAMVATSRPGAEVQPLADLPNVTTMELPAIDDAAMGELASHLWATHYGQAPADSLSEELVERSAGSPLFCEQLVSFAHSQEVGPAAEALPADIGVPTTLTDLVLARLDALPEAAVAVASYAAVFGRTFAAADVLGAFSKFQDWSTIAGGLEILRDRGIITGLDRHRFSHSLFAETTYERLSYGLRAELHLAALVYLEGTRAHELEGLASELARHAEFTIDDDRKRRYFRVAADQAAAAYANDVSIYWYRKLVELLQGHDRGQVELVLGEIELVSGDLSRAEAYLSSATDHLPSEARVSADLARIRAMVRLGKSEVAMTQLDQVVNGALADESWVELRVALETKADLSTLQGDISRAEEVESLLLALANNPLVPAQTSSTMQELAPLDWLRGDLEAAVSGYRRWCDVALSLGDLRSAGQAYADLAGIWFESNELGATFAAMGHARSLLERVGDERSIILNVRCNEVRILVRLGEVGKAREIALHAVASALPTGDISMIASCLPLLGLVPGTARRETILERAVALLDKTGDRNTMAETAYYLTLAWRQVGRFAEAETLLREIACHWSTMFPEAELDLFAIRANRCEAELTGDLQKFAARHPNNELGARALVLVHELNPSDDSRQVALAACETAYRSFPSLTMRQSLGMLTGLEPEAQEFGVNASPMGSAPSLDQLLATIDRLPALAEWNADPAGTVATALDRLSNGL